MKAFPIAWVTTGKTLLIVGGGFETDARLKHALAFEWDKIRLIMKEIPPDLRAAGAVDSRVEFCAGSVGEEDVADADLVLEDSGDRATAERLRAWCDKYHVPLNATDKPDLCDCYYMSMLFRDPLVICIGSGGNAPAISSSLRRHLDAEIGPGWAAAASVMAETRRRLPGGQARYDLLKKIARHPSFLDFIRKNDAAGMRYFVENELRSI